MIASALDRYWGRLTVYFLGAVVGSALGSTFTWDSSWVHADPLTAGPYMALLSVGPAIGVAAFAALSGRAVLSLSLCFAAAMLWMWWAFASSESSTAGIVFLMGSIVGAPISAALVLLTSRSQRSGPAKRPPVVERQWRSHR